MITGTFHCDIGTTISINGTFEGIDETADSPKTLETVDWRGHLDVKDDPPFSQFGVDAVLDEFKLYYGLLNSEGQ